MSGVVIIADSDEEDMNARTSPMNRSNLTRPNNASSEARPTDQELRRKRLLHYERTATGPNSADLEVLESESAAPRKRQALDKERASEAIDTEAIDLEANERQENSRNASSSGRRQSWISPFQLLRAQGIPDYANRSPTGMRLRDVVSGDMKWVLVSNYMIDMGWLLSACPDLQKAGFVQVVHGESHPMMLKLIKEEAKLVGLVQGKNLAIHAPPLPIPYGTHHSKAFLIEYENGIRVVIHTANLVHCDNNFKTQGLWCQDFPKKDAQSPASSSFENDLLDYVRALQIPASLTQQTSVIARLRQFDFSSARVHLISSKPGRHPEGTKVGHVSLREKLSKELFDPEFRGAPCFCQFSSLGSLTGKWLQDEFHRSLSAGQYPDEAGKRPLGFSPSDETGFQIIWPTVDEVRNSLEGWAAGRSIPGFQKNVEKPFLQKHWHRFGGEPMGRQRAQPHIKSYGRYVFIPGKGTKLAWFVLASHNLSKAAWGSFFGGEKLFVRSYELGVLFLPSLEAAYRVHRHCGFFCGQKSPISLPEGQGDEAVQKIEFWTKTDPSTPEEQDCKMYFPLPYKLPPKRYEEGDQPWMADFPFPGLDAYGKRRDDDFPPIYGFTE